MENLFLIAGLGNPGTGYARTRHNAGFQLVDRLARRWGAAWKHERKFESRLARAEWTARKILLCQPQTFMNASGDAVGAVSEYFQIARSRLLVVVDEADLPVGGIRLRAGGSSGGHHGLESIETRLGSRDYARLRIGIGRRADGVREITDHVLSRFTGAETELVEKVFDRTVAQVECWLTDGIGKAMSLFNGVVEDSAEPKTE
jgi:PTH1 family peptidyl-tRNA hydrolase